MIDVWNRTQYPDCGLFIQNITSDNNQGRRDTHYKILVMAQVWMDSKGSNYDKWTDIYQGDLI